MFDFPDPDQIGALLASLLMLAGGGFGLRRARRMNAALRRLEGTRLSSIAKARLGPVRVRGRAGCAETVLSPLSKTPCCAYRVEVDEVVSEDEGSAWCSLRKEVSRASFALQDGTGAISIGTAGLDFDVAWSMEHQVIAKAKNPFEQGLVDYLPQSSRGHQKKVRDRYLRFREMCVLPGDEFEAAGTLALADGKRTLTKGTEAVPFTLSSATGREMNHRQRKKVRSMALWSAGVMVAGVLAPIIEFS